MRNWYTVSPSWNNVVKWNPKLTWTTEYECPYFFTQSRLKQWSKQTAHMSIGKRRWNKTAHASCRVIRALKACISRQESKLFTSVGLCYGLTSNTTHYQQLITIRTEIMLNPAFQSQVLWKQAKRMARLTSWRVILSKRKRLRIFSANSTHLTSGLYLR